MNGLEAVNAVEGAPIHAITQASALGPSFASPAPREAAPSSASESFGELIVRGAAEVEARVDRADRLVRAFVVDGSIPVHQVTIALEEARIAVELALQVRARLVEAYRDIMNMQL